MNNIVQAIYALAGVFSRQRWMVVPVMVANLAVGLALGYTADMTTGVVSKLSAVFALIVMFWGTGFIGFANIEARHTAK